MFPRFFTQRKSFILLSVLFILLAISSCIEPANNNGDNAGIELLGPRNNSNSVEFNKAILTFKSASAGEYEVVVEENDTGMQTISEVVEVQEGIPKTVLLPKGKLKPSTKYRWFVKSKNSSAMSQVWYFTTVPNSEPTVSSLQPNGVQNVRFDSLTLSWDAADPDEDDLMFLVKVIRGSLIVLQATATTNYITVENLEQLTDYTWQVQAMDPWGGVSTLSSASFRTIANKAPSKVELINPQPNATDVDFNTLELRWQGYDEDTPVLYYTVELIESGISQVVVSNSTVTSYTVNNLKRNTKYDIKITATDKYGASISSTFTFTTKLSTPPNKPTLSEPTSNARINLALVDKLRFVWSEAIDPDGDGVSYELVIKSDYDGWTIKRSPLNSTSYELSSANALELFNPGKTYDPARSYTWYVIAKDSYGVQTSSEQVKFYMYYNNPPEQPSNPIPANSLTTLVPNRVSFGWSCSDADNDALSYSVYFGEHPDALVPIASELSNSTFNYQNLLEFDKIYYWKVVVSDGVNTPVEGPVWNFKVMPRSSAPTKPELVYPANSSTGVAFNNTNFKWNSSSDNSAKDKLIYLLYVFESAQADDITPVATVTGVTDDVITVNLSDVPLLPNKDYKWYVVVIDEDGNYILSDTWSFKTKENTAPEFPYNGSPNNVTVEVTALPSKITLSWNCSDPDGDTLKYKVYWKVPGSSTFSPVSSSYITESTIDVNVSKEGVYYWYVEAYDPHGGVSTGVYWNFTLRKK